MSQIDKLKIEQHLEIAGQELQTIFDYLNSPTEPEPVQFGLGDEVTHKDLGLRSFIKNIKVDDVTVDDGSQELNWNKENLILIRKSAKHELVEWDVVRTIADGKEGQIIEINMDGAPPYRIDDGKECKWVGKDWFTFLRPGKPPEELVITDEDKLNHSVVGDMKETEFNIGGWAYNNIKKVAFCIDSIFAYRLEDSDGNCYGRTASTSIPAPKYGVDEWVERAEMTEPPFQIKKREWCSQWSQWGYYKEKDDAWLEEALAPIDPPKYNKGQWAICNIGSGTYQISSRRWEHGSKKWEYSCVIDGKEEIFNYEHLLTACDPPGKFKVGGTVYNSYTKEFYTIENDNQLSAVISNDRWKKVIHLQYEGMDRCICGEFHDV